MSSSQYIPGTCNIGSGEIRRRQVVAIIGSIISISSFVTLLMADAPRNARYGIFVPLMIASVGWVQSRSKFCLAYGFAGTFNMGKLGDISRVADAASKAADRKTALTILVKSTALAAIITLLVVLLPF
ncbi:unannotated protein [freshwater metagenome]|uniref:Unannotated protein n=1 Tax=freshwater metagenome TaxID=449393 RepID=A0A6J7PM50_9ZZZZ|nr:hypothetical protein [Actinomycetota bacterium]MSW06286.1 hypothetical protein [Actinomycetota bacterium]MTA70766.1 hypothetical protein [Actinomycetota bacterium]